MRDYRNQYQVIDWAIMGPRVEEAVARGLNINELMAELGICDSSIRNYCAKRDIKIAYLGGERSTIVEVETLVDPFGAAPPELVES